MSLQQLIAAVQADMQALYAIPAAPSAANPTAKVGATPVNGTAATFMRSDAAPPIDLTAAYTWTAVQTFAPAAAANPSRVLASKNTTSGIDDVIERAGSTANTVGAGPNTQWIDTTANTATLIQHAGGQTERWVFNGGWAQLDKVLTNGSIQFNYGFSIHGVTPPAQVTGFGTPTGASVVANFSGTAATTAQIQATIAEILTILKSYGMIGA